MFCIVCSKEDENPVGWIVFYELYNELIDHNSELRPMGTFCKMSCASAWTAQAARLEIKAQNKKK